VQHKIKQEQMAQGEYTSEENASPKAMTDVFCSTSMMQNTPYMARGIYEDDDCNDQNHTFCVIGHERRRTFFFSVVECVTPVLVLNVRTREKCLQRQRAFAKNYGTKSPMHVMNKEMMALRYKHILWVGPYMVFECVAKNGRRAAFISFGAGSYKEYTGALCCVVRGCVRVVCGAYFACIVTTCANAT